MTSDDMTVEKFNEIKNTNNERPFGKNNEVENLACRYAISALAGIVKQLVGPQKYDEVIKFSLRYTEANLMSLLDQGVAQDPLNLMKSEDMAVVLDCATDLDNKDKQTIKDFVKQSMSLAKNYLLLEE